MSAETFNKIRRITFSLYHKCGYEDSTSYLNAQQEELGRKGYIGLKAELEFYHNYRGDLELDVGADVGDHCDFSGILGSEKFRIDVTTNFNFKAYNEFEPLIEDGAKYKIALIDRENFELSEIIDINFPKCKVCNEGRLFDLVLLGDENITMGGNRTWSYDQIHFKYCNNCGSYFEEDRIRTVQLPDYDTLDVQLKELYDPLMDDKEYLEKLYSEEFNRFITNTKNYLKNKFECIPFGLCNNTFIEVNPRTGEGYKETELFWQENFLQGHIPTHFGELVLE
ncbi:hypothetical protein [Fodinibius salsisoli]|uniref:Uncharacterized protein n=1 Tax=Fodinibius salsisoli TaxID=2820877 RepID=A0ABT3PIP2_9BACT|nr:hypothetical protein [Fodinibius salsisoli]MCW9705779.1 hypothetical protein [Fodinibius salsisoli]